MKRLSVKLSPMHGMRTDVIMSNVRDLFPGAQNQQPIEQPSLEITGNPEFLIVSTLEEARERAAAENARPRTMVAISHTSARSLEKTALGWRQTPYFLFVRTLSSLILDEAFEMPAEELAIDLSGRARSFQLRTDFFQAVSEFSAEHGTTPDTLAHVAVAHYLPVAPPPLPGNPFKPRRHLRAV